MTTHSRTGRADLRRRLTDDGPALLVPLALDPLAARQAAALGFEAVYLSGGALGYQYAVSEALLSLTEVADVARRITARCPVPLIVDGGVGFGDPVHATRAIWEVEAAGAAAIEIEDQVAPKRVSHHRGIEHLIDTGDMVAKIRHAAAARTDPDLVIIARTGAVANESFEAAVERAGAYREAGADAILLMPRDEEQWRRAPAEIDAPLVTFSSLATRSAREWAERGWRVILDPFSAQVLAHQAVERFYRAVLDGGPAPDPDEVMAGYRLLPAEAGLDELYDIERATTEPGT
jgi:methylisocitrate lyase